MGETIRHLVWFAIVATAASYTIFAVLGNFVTVNAENSGPVEIRDVLNPGVHDLSGMVMLPSSCDELTVNTQKLSTSTYILSFQSWSDPSVPCPTTETPREFHATLFAPATGIRFIATLNGTGLPILVVPDISATSS